jgi:hypothetical protein
MVGTCDTYYGIMVGKETNLKTRRRWEDSIKMDTKELGRKSVDWINLA